MGKIYLSKAIFKKMNTNQWGKAFVCRPIATKRLSFLFLKSTWAKANLFPACNTIASTIIVSPRLTPRKYLWTAKLPNMSKDSEKICLRDVQIDADARKPAFMRHQCSSGYDIHQSRCQASMQSAHGIFMFFFDCKFADASSTAAFD